MAEIKNYGLIGVGQNVQLGKNGPKLKGNSDNSTFEITSEDGATLARISGADGTSSTDFVTKAQLDASSVSFRKANLTAVYADGAINEGDIIEVADNGDGEYAVYMAKQDAPTTTGHLTLMSSKDSAGGDGATLSATVQYNSGTVTLGDVSATSRPMDVLIEVTAVFDGDTAITIGDDSNNSRLMSASYVDLSETTVFQTNPSYVYNNAIDANNTIKVYVTTSSGSTGTANVRVSYS